MDYSNHAITEVSRLLRFASEVITSDSSNWFTLLLLCTRDPLVLCCDRFNCGSRQVKRDQVDLVTEDYDITLCWQIGGSHPFICWMNRKNHTI